MRIFVASPGHLRTMPMGRYCAETFRGMGHEVLLFDASTSTFAEKLFSRALGKLGGRKRHKKEGLNQRLKRAVELFQPDFFLSILGIDLFPETIAFIRKKGIPTVCWWINDPIQLQRGLSIAPAYDFFFSNCEHSTNQHLKHGIKTATYLPHAAFLPIHHPSNPDSNDSQWKSEVCFLGDWGSVRQGMFTMLCHKGVDLRIWGPWNKHLEPKNWLRKKVIDGFFTPEEMGQMLCNTKLALNLHAWFGYYDYGLNPRTFETPAYGVVQLVDWKESLNKHFREDEEIVTYKTGVELEGKIKDLLANDKARQKIAGAGLKRVLSEHTYEHRMKQMLSRIKG